MALVIRLATVADRIEIRNYWNERRLVETSWFRYAPEVTSLWIAQILSHSFEILCCRDNTDDSFQGFGIYKGAKICGFTAKGPLAFYRLLRQYCIRNPGVNAFSIMPAIVSQELVWLQALNVAIDISPIAYEPLTPEQIAGKTREEIIAMRKVWVRRCNAVTTELLAAIDAILGI